MHIAMVCAGHNSTFGLVTTVKSILFHRIIPLHFHLLVDEIAMRSLVVLFETWDLPQGIISQVLFLSIILNYNCLKSQNIPGLPTLAMFF